MATTLDTILIEFGAQWTGGGAIQRLLTDINRVARATKDIYDPIKNTANIPMVNALSSPFTTAAVSVLKYRSQLEGVETQMRQLGQAMAGLGTRGNPFIGLGEQDQVRVYAALAQQANVLKDAISRTAPAADTAGTSLAGFVKTLAIVGTTVGLTVGALHLLTSAFMGVKEVAEQGAVIRQTAESFAFLSSEIYDTSGLLQQMRAASRGTIPDLQLMSSYLTLIAGTTPEFGKTLSDAVPQLLEIAKAANVLNPTLGDTTYFFDSLARGIKRSEIRILDNLGLVVKVGEANRRWAEAMGTTVEAMSAEERQMALLNETLRVGALLIEQVGGKTSSLLDPYQQLDASSRNIFNSMKELVSISFEPTIQGLAGVVMGLDQWFQRAAATYAIMQEIAALNMDRIDDLPALPPVLGVGITQQGAAYKAAIDSLIQAQADLGHFEFKSQQLIDNQIVQAIAQAVGPIQTSANSIQSAMQQIYGSQVEFFDTRQGSMAVITSGMERYVVMLGQVEELIRAISEAEQQAVINQRSGSWFVNQGISLPEITPQERRRQAAAYVDSILPSEVEQLAITRWRQFRDVADRINGEMRDSIASMQQGWVELAAARQADITSAWLDIFSGGEFDSNLNDVQIFKDFINTIGQSGATVQQLSSIAQGLGLIGPEAADAMLKVSLLESVLKNIDLQLQAGEIDASQVPDAVRGAIAALEQSGTYYDLVANVRVSVAQATAEVARELRLPEEDRTREIDVAANLDPAQRALAGALGMIDNAQSQFKIDADDSPARSLFESLVADIENTVATLEIQGVYRPPSNQPSGQPNYPTTGTSIPFAEGGYVGGGRGRPVAAIVHGGEFVMRPEAVDRLGVGFLSQLNRGMGSVSNNISVQTNFYGAVGNGDVREIVVRAGDNAAEQLVDVLKRSGYKL